MADELSGIDELSEEKLDEYCSKSDSKVLAAHVVVYRLLHIHQALAKRCMNELSKRAFDGDQFDFEQYINEKLEQMPKAMDTEKRLFLDRIVKSDMRKI